MDPKVCRVPNFYFKKCLPKIVLANQRVFFFNTEHYCGIYNYKINQNKTKKENTNSK